MSANEKNTEQNEQAENKQAEERHDEREVKDTELNVEALEERIAPATIVELG